MERAGQTDRQLGNVFLHDPVQDMTCAQYAEFAFRQNQHIFPVGDQRMVFPGRCEMEKLEVTVRMQIQVGSHGGERLGEVEVVADYRVGSVRFGAEEPDRSRVEIAVAAGKHCAEKSAAMLLQLVGCRRIAPRN